MQKQLYSFLKYNILITIMLFAFSCIEKEEDSEPQGTIEMEYLSQKNTLTAQAVRNRNHKNITLHIYSVSTTNNIALDILINPYANTDQPQVLPAVYTFPAAQFVMVTSKFYQAVSGKVTILTDDNKQVEGVFSFSAVDVTNRTDTIKVSDGRFSIAYLPSTAYY